MADPQCEIVKCGVLWGFYTLALYWYARLTRRGIWRFKTFRAKLVGIFLASDLFLLASRAVDFDGFWHCLDEDYKITNFSVF